MAPIVLALEDRLKSSVALVAGLPLIERYSPETDPFNFATRVTTPMLMITGEYDVVFPVESSGRPMYELINVAPEHKEFVIAPADHMVPRNLLMGEVLDWFDKYQPNN